MKIIHFRQLRLFKNDEIIPFRKKAPPDSKENLSWIKKVVSSPFFYITIFSLLLSFVISFFPARPLPQIKVGEIATKDITSPVEITVEDIQATEKRRSQAESTVPPVYFHNERIISSVQEKIKQMFALGRAAAARPTASTIKELQRQLSENLTIDLDDQTLDQLLKLKFPVELENLSSQIMASSLNKEIVLSRELMNHGEFEKGLLIIRGKEEKLLKAGEVIDMKEARQNLLSEVEALELPPRTKSILKSWLPVLLSPTISYDQAETEARKLKIRNSVESVFYTIKKGKVIIRKGDEVTSEHLRQIILINQKISHQPHWLFNFSGLAILYFILFYFIWLVIEPVSKAENKLSILTMMGLTLFLSFLVTKASLFLAEALSHSATPLMLEKEALIFAFPLQFGAFLITLATSAETAVVYCVINSLLTGYLLNGDYFLIIYILLGGVSVIYGLKYFFPQSRSTVLKTGLMVVAPFQVILVLIFHLIKQSFENLSILSTELVSSLIGGLLSAAIAYVLMPVFESIFGFLTPSKLYELSNSDLPVFRRLALEAPGTYHHSLIVATLAEKAAEVIKADSVLVRAAGLYHDLGKLKRPEYFSENQIPGYDIHRELTPSLSTLVIVNHVREGVEMARKVRLPRRIIDIISQHHGTSIVRYFYHKAKERYDPELHKIEVEDFRYPGPLPRSKEAGLIMLADSVEAAARSLKSPTRENLKRVITEIFNTQLQDGQLDECGFSLKELRVIANSYLTTLYAIYHPRPTYPGFDFEKKTDKTEKTDKTDKKEEVKKDNGHNNKQPEEKSGPQEKN
ncbi:MAG: HDIG domain-containing protein [Acidobacteriota bacterium]|nr:HDIG domain-containing protein [Acidobacteriota bacterium]